MAIVHVFLCPSTVEEQLHSIKGNWRGQAFTDYGGAFGVEGEGTDSLSDGSSQPIADRWLGVFLYNVPVTVPQITDGLSHTVNVAERINRRSSTSEWPCGRNIFAQEQSTALNQQSGYGNEIGSPHPGGALLSFCDSHVEFTSEGIELPVLHAVLTKAGGEAQ